jgi:zinc finger HIT domain-containing protein 1
VSFLGEEEDDGGGKSAKGRARQTISDKRHLNDGSKKKKSSMNVRTALLYRKNLATLIDESVSCNILTMLQS